jgi:hypothetical protein
VSVGGQGGVSTVNSSLTNLSVGIRNLMEGVADTSTWVQGQGNGNLQQGLINLGYSTIPTATNPGGVSDAQLASNLLGYLTTLSGVYYGTVQQGGSGGTNATMFNFNNALGYLWAGQ